jgi:exopolyphosphatase/guanosine-5'-triphosphate,3'-diphosphate pyrophosphatase
MDCKIDYNNIMKTRRLVIDIGTNSVLALLADVSGSSLSVISDQKKTTRLGEGLYSRGELTPEAMRRTADAVCEFAKESDYDDLIMIGTEALRSASNSSLLLRMIGESLGKEPIIVSGLKEAELSFLGARYNLNLESDNIIFIDVGGGSTEFVVARSGEVSSAVSVPIGALKLRESVNQHSIKIYINEAKRAIEKIIIGLKIPPQLSIIATGGTITSTAAIKLGTGHFVAAEVHGSVLTVGDMKEIALKFERTDPEDRIRLIPFDPERAELILPGLAIYLAILGILSRQFLIVSVGGIRFGAALFPDKLLT